MMHKTHLIKIENDSAESVVTVVAPTEEPTEEEIEAMEGEQQTEEPEGLALVFMKLHTLS